MLFRSAVYLQTAQAELLEAVSGRTEVAEKDCGEIRLTEKSEPTEGTEMRKARSNRTRIVER